MIDQPLPPELQVRWGHLPDIKQRGVGHWTSACPNCGGTSRPRRDLSDRFRMWDNDPAKGLGPRGSCRQCGYFEFADSNNRKHDPEELARLQAERIALQQQEIERLRNIIHWLSGRDFWIEAHKEMTPSQRKLWEDEVPDWCIDLHNLGYFDKPREFAGPGGEIVWVSGDSLSIPFLSGGLGPENIQTLQLRLVHPPDEGDKYRFASGLYGARKFFFPMPDENDLSQVTVVVEGAKKAMWLYHLFMEANTRLTYLDRPVTIMAIASKYLEHRAAEELRDTPVIWMLDPDAYEPVRKKDGKWLPPVVAQNAEKIRRNRFVRLPGGKVDDLIKEGIFGVTHIQNMIDGATKSV